MVVCFGNPGVFFANLSVVSGELVRLATENREIDVEQEFAIARCRRIDVPREQHQGGDSIDDFGRRVAKRRKSVRQLRPRFRFDLVDEAVEDVVEKLDVLIVEAIGTVEKKRGDAFERLRPPRRPKNAVFELMPMRSGLFTNGRDISGGISLIK